jgi:hypothetical protein
MLRRMILNTKPFEPPILSGQAPPSVPPPFRLVVGIAMASMLASLLTVGPACQAVAAPVDITFSDPLNDTNQDVTIVIEGGGITRNFPVTIKPNVKAAGKRDAIFDVLSKTFTVVNAFGKMGEPGISLLDLAAGTIVTFKPGMTGEGADTTFTANATNASLGFENALFASTDPLGNTSLFTAGIITDIGELSATIPASSLSALDGTTIAEALFAELDAQAPAFGASISEVGDILNITFDPLDTLLGAGVIFGTTAATDGVFGSVTVSAPEPATLVLVVTSLLALGLFPRGPRTA